MTTAIPVAREAGADTFFKLAFAMGVLVVREARLGDKEIDQATEKHPAYGQRHKHPD